MEIATLSVLGLIGIVVIYLMTQIKAELKRLGSESTGEIKALRMELRTEVEQIWDSKLSDTIRTLTSEDILAETLSRMPEDQLDRLATKTAELRDGHE